MPAYPISGFVNRRVRAIGDILNDPVDENYQGVLSHLIKSEVVDALSMLGLPAEESEEDRIEMLAGEYVNGLANAAFALREMTCTLVAAERVMKKRGNGDAANQDD